MLFDRPVQNLNTNKTEAYYRARPAMIKPRRPAPAMATRVSGAALPEDEAELPELVDVGEPLLLELEPERVPVVDAEAPARKSAAD